MKTCPVCKSLCFDDMPVCYGCMHDFTRIFSDDPEEAVEPAGNALPAGGVSFDATAERSQPVPRDDGAVIAQGKEKTPGVGADNRAFARRSDGSVSSDNAVRRFSREMRPFGASGSAVPEDEGVRPVAGLSIPMITSPFSNEARPDTTARIFRRVESADADPREQRAPSITFEAPRGCRFILQMEPT